MTDHDADGEWALRHVTLHICEGCIGGQGGQCHTPGCILWMHDVDAIPLNRDAITFHPEVEPKCGFDYMDDNEAFK